MTSTDSLKAFFSPQTIAVFGASDRPSSVGGKTFANLLEQGFQGRVYAINPQHQQVHGQSCYPDLAALPETIDLAIIATPATSVAAIAAHCTQHGVRNLVVLSAGFREIGAAGKALEAELLSLARAQQLRLIGPNCFGIMRPGIGMNATFGIGRAKPGKLALIAQSGALCAAILDWASNNDVGFSSIFSTGIGADIECGELLEFLRDDAETEAVLLYLEGLNRPEVFMQALRAITPLKPVIVLKSGRSQQSRHALNSHAGALIGADDVWDAALARAGAVRVAAFGDFFAAAKLLASGIRTQGQRLAIITNGGGAGILAVDRLAHYQLPLAELSATTLSALNAVLPSTWPGANPIDLIGDATAERYRQAINICLAAPEIDALLVILIPQAITAPRLAAETLLACDNPQGKPVLACWMGEATMHEARDLFNEHGLPHFRTPEASIDAFYFLVSHWRHQQLRLLKDPPQQATASAQAKALASALAIMDVARNEGRELLSELESKALLSAFGIPVAQGATVSSLEAALQTAEQLGYPVALKIDSPDIPHKSDVGGVRLNISSAAELQSHYTQMLASVRQQRPDARIKGVVVEHMCIRPQARELMLGMLTDPVFGPVLSFGLGGTAVEVLQDRAIALPPLNDALIKTLIQSTRANKLLDQFRNLPATNRALLEDVIAKVAELVAALPAVSAIDINPLLLDQDVIIAVDARVYIKHT